MKLVAISDIHSQSYDVNIPDGDILVIAGDLCAYGNISELIVLNDWLRTLPHKRKIITAGNNDKYIFDCPYDAKKILTHGELYLHEPFQFEVDGKIFNGFASPYSKEFGNWYFMHHDNSEGERLWSQVPDDTDLLVTHGPPYGLLDKLAPQYIRRGEDSNVGSTTLLKAVKRVNPAIHIFGHIHSRQGVIRNGNTVFVNAALCNEQYRPENSVAVLDLNVKSGNLVVSKIYEI